MPDVVVDRGRRRGTPWMHYGCEAVLLGAFMVSACVFGVLLFHPASFALQIFPAPLARRCVMGAAMGATAILLIYSPLGRRSGAHMNPATTVTFWRLGKVRTADVIGYVASQFAGAVGGMLIAATLLGRQLAHPDVRYVTTVPAGESLFDLSLAWLAEFMIAGVLIFVVLYSSNRRRLAPYTGVIAGAVVMIWIVVEAPVSGMSMNPARSFGSALLAGFDGAAGTSLWIYFTAPPLGMLAAAGAYAGNGSVRRVHCAKLCHDASSPCIFNCEFAVLSGDVVVADGDETLTALAASKA